MRRFGTSALQTLAVVTAAEQENINKTGYEEENISYLFSDISYVYICTCKSDDLIWIVKSILVLGKRECELSQAKGC